MAKIEKFGEMQEDYRKKTCPLVYAVHLKGNQNVSLSIKDVCGVAGLGGIGGNWGGIGAVLQDKIRVGADV